MFLFAHFQHGAEQYGRIIISERYLPVKDKTIHPLDIGGVAGGDKYICRGILFKVCSFAGGSSCSHRSFCPVCY